MGAICGRCGEPREAHGGPAHLGACPGESGIQAKRFSIATGDRPELEWEEPCDRLPLPPRPSTGVDDLIVWLRAQWDAEERTAKAAASLCGCHPPSPNWAFADDENDGRIVIADEPHGYHPLVGRLGICRRWNRSVSDMFFARHIAYWDPARVLADIAVKRSVLAEHESYGGYGEHCRTCHHPHDQLAAGAPSPCLTVRLLAQPYSGRPGWRQEWDTPSNSG